MVACPPYVFVRFGFKDEIFFNNERMVQARLAPTMSSQKGYTKELRGPYGAQEEGLPHMDDSLEPGEVQITSGHYQFWRAEELLDTSRNSLGELQAKSAMGRTTLASYHIGSLPFSTSWGATRCITELIERASSQVANGPHHIGELKPLGRASSQVQ